MTITSEQVENIQKEIWINTGEALVEDGKCETMEEALRVLFTVPDFVSWLDECGELYRELAQKTVDNGHDLEEFDYEFVVKAVF